MTLTLNNPFEKKENFRFPARDVVVFIFAALVAWGMNVVGHMFFPGQQLASWLVRNVLSATAALLLIVASVKLLKKSGLDGKSLGLQLTPAAIWGFVLGLLLAVTAMLILGGLIYIFVPYHFIKGPLGTTEVLKLSISFLWGNFTEELMFRGYPLLVLCPLLGWRAAVCIMAVPFGLFHLPGLGFSMAGWKMVLTTVSFSFVFAYAFILTGTLWTAVGAHVASNILLHAVTGLDGSGQALLTPVFEAGWPSHYDAGLLAFETAAIVVAVGLYLLIVKQRREDRVMLNVEF